MANPVFEFSVASTFKVINIEEQEKYGGETWKRALLVTFDREVPRDYSALAHKTAREAVSVTYGIALENLKAVPSGFGSLVIIKVY